MSIKDCSKGIQRTIIKHFAPQQLFNAISDNTTNTGVREHIHKTFCQCFTCCSGFRHTKGRFVSNNRYTHMSIFNKNHAKNHPASNHAGKASMSGNAFNITNSTFTAPEDGIYSFTGAIHFKSITAGNLIYAFLIAGNKNYNSSWRNSSGSVEIVCINMTLFLAAGETAQLWGYVNDSAPPASVSGNSTDNYAFTYFSGAKVH